MRHSRLPFFLPALICSSLIFFFYLVGAYHFLQQVLTATYHMTQPSLQWWHLPAAHSLSPAGLRAPGSAPRSLQSVGALPTSSLSTGSGSRKRLPSSDSSISDPGHHLAQSNTKHCQSFPNQHLVENVARGRQLTAQIPAKTHPGPWLAGSPGSIMHGCVRNPSIAPILTQPQPMNKKRK